MKWIMYILAGLLIIIGVILISLSVLSRQQTELGLQNGKLIPCTKKPNCVCSEHQDKQAYIKPFTYDGSEANAWKKIKQAVTDSGGKIIMEDSHYLRAVYQTALLRFIDDVEFRLDSDNRKIHVRSASRVGHSDLGANRNRVKKIRTNFKRLNTQ